MENLTEHEMTVAVDAAARKLWDLRRESRPWPEFDKIHPVDQNAIRDEVLPFAMAAIEALPDRADRLRDELHARIADYRDRNSLAMPLGELELAIKA